MTTIQIKNWSLGRTDFNNIDELSEYLLDSYFDFKFINYSDLSLKQKLKAEEFDPNNINSKKIFNI